MKKAIVLALALFACTAPRESTTTSELAAYAASAAGGGTSGTGDRSVVVSAGANALIVAYASISGNTQTAPTMSDNNGGTYTLVARAAWGGNNMVAFVRDTLHPFNGTTVVTLDTDTNTAAQLTAVTFSGMTRTGSSAVRQIALVADGTASTTASTTYSTGVLTGNPTIVGVASGDTTTTPPTGWTERKDTSQSTPTTALEVATRNSGYTGTGITWGDVTSTTYAAIALELDTSTGPPPVDAGVDAPAPDAPIDSAVDASIDSPIDAPSGGGGGGTLSYGATGTVFQLYGHGDGTVPVSITRTTSSGSTFVLLLGGMSSDCDTAPFDNKGNTYTKLARYDFTNWPGYASCAWFVKNGNGGTTHTFSHYVTAWDERTMVLVEVLGAGSSPTIAHTFAQVGNSGAYTPGTGTNTKNATAITVSADALELGAWFGAGPPNNGNNTATPSEGTIVGGYGIDHPDGYIQEWVSAYPVTAGTYAPLWTWSPKQGAQLWNITITP